MQSAGLALGRLWRLITGQHLADPATQGWELRSNPLGDSSGLQMSESASNSHPMRKRVRLLNVEVDNITMNELVESFREGLLLTSLNMVLS
jgi:hypothetical protein